MLPEFINAIILAGRDGPGPRGPDPPSPTRSGGLEGVKLATVNALFFSGMR